MRIAIHQPNFVPWFPFFYKMSACDRFILLTQCQFEKNGYQNRYRIGDRWVTKPVAHGLEPIRDKCYLDGQSLLALNRAWIDVIAQTLTIQTPIIEDIVTTSTGTQRLIENLQHYGGTTYVTSSRAKDKYLNEALLRAAGIDIVYCDTPYQLPIFEMFERFGIDGTQRQLYRVPHHAEPEPILSLAE